MRKSMMGPLVAAAPVALIAVAMSARPASAAPQAGVYLSGDVYCAGNGDACCDQLNCGSSCHGTVRGWNYGTFYCDQIETQRPFREAVLEPLARN